MIRANAARLSRLLLLLVGLVAVFGGISALAYVKPERSCNQEPSCCYGKYLHCYIDCNYSSDCSDRCWRNYQVCLGNYEPRPDDEDW